MSPYYQTDNTTELSLEALQQLVAPLKAALKKVAFQNYPLYGQAYDIAVRLEKQTSVPAHRMMQLYKISSAIVTTLTDENVTLNDQDNESIKRLEKHFNDNAFFMEDPRNPRRLLHWNDMMDGPRPKD